MSRFDDIPDEMTSEEYLKMTTKSRFRGKGRKRVEAKHVWVNYSSPHVIYEDKAAACDAAGENEMTLHFASMSEAKRYAVLRQEQMEGIISLLNIQPVYELVAYGAIVFSYKGDFSYMIVDGAIPVIEEIKSYQKNTGKWYIANGESKLKIKMFEALRAEKYADMRFYLVSSSGYSQLVSEAKFA